MLCYNDIVIGVCVCMHAQYGKLCTIIMKAVNYNIELHVRLSSLSINQLHVTLAQIFLIPSLSRIIPLSLLPFNMVGHCCREGAV